MPLPSPRRPVAREDLSCSAGDRELREETFDGVALSDGYFSKKDLTPLMKASASCGWAKRVTAITCSSWKAVESRECLDGERSGSIFSRGPHVQVSHSRRRRRSRVRTHRPSLQNHRPSLPPRRDFVPMAMLLMAHLMGPWNCK